MSDSNGKGTTLWSKPVVKGGQTLMSLCARMQLCCDGGATPSAVCMYAMACLTHNRHTEALVHPNGRHISAKLCCK